MRKTTSGFMTLLVYVDDIILAGVNAEQMREVKASLKKKNSRSKTLDV